MVNSIIGLQVLDVFVALNSSFIILLFHSTITNYYTRHYCEKNINKSCLYSRNNVIEICSAFYKDINQIIINTQLFVSIFLFLFGCLYTLVFNLYSKQLKNVINDNGSHMYSILFVSLPLIIIVYLLFKKRKTLLHSDNEFYKYFNYIQEHLLNQNNPNTNNIYKCLNYIYRNINQCIYIVNSLLAVIAGFMIISSRFIFRSDYLSMLISIVTYMVLFILFLLISIKSKFSIFWNSDLPILYFDDFDVD